MSLEPGSVIDGRYRVESILGRGGFGVTAAATEIASGRRVAIKRLDLHDVEDWKTVELFEREAEVLRRLDHPRIPHYVEFLPIQADRAGLLIQELAPGRSLQAHLDDNRLFSEPEVRHIALQLLAVLDYLGRLDPAVVHRDIKPANVVLDDRGDVRLIDFGSVKEAAARATSVGSTVAGTFGYMAPEQIQGVAEPRSDLYALGMTMIALLTGTAPTDLPRRRLKPSFRDLVDISPALASFIDRLIEPVPDDRYADAAAATAALEDAIATATFADPGADLGALVEARELEKRQEERRGVLAAQRQRERDATRLARRADRVRVAASDDGRLRVVFEPKPLSDHLKAQLPWGFGFAFVNPGVFITFGIVAALVGFGGLSIGAAIAVGIPLWAILLTLVNVCYAQLARHRRTLEITREGHFAVYEKSPKKPLLIGRSGQLDVDIPEPDPARLQTVRIRDGQSRVDIERLSARDLDSLRDALRGRCQLD